MGSVRVVKMLAEQGANVNEMSEEHGTPVAAASAKGHVEVVQMLLDCGANATSWRWKVKDSPESPLSAAVRSGHKSIARLLIDRGAHINRRLPCEENALSSAAAAGRDSLVNFLLQKGAPINADDARWGNAICAAYRHGDTEMVQVLINHGVDVNAGGKYPPSKERRLNMHNMHRGFYKDGIIDIHSNALYAAALRGHREIVQLLLDNGADVNAESGTYCGSKQSASHGTNRMKALHWAVVGGHPKTAVLLMAAGAEIEALDNEGSTPLHIAATRCLGGMVQYLVRYGASLRKEDSCGQTPLDCARESRSHVRDKKKLRHFDFMIEWMELQLTENVESLSEDN